MSKGRKLLRQAEKIMNSSADGREFILVPALRLVHLATSKQPIAENARVELTKRLELLDDLFTRELDE